MGLNCSKTSGEVGLGACWLCGEYQSGTEGVCGNDAASHPASWGHQGKWGLAGQRKYVKES